MGKFHVRNDKCHDKIIESCGVSHVGVDGVGHVGVGSCRGGVGWVM